MNKVKRILIMFVFLIIVIIKNISWAGNLGGVDDLSGLDSKKYPQMQRMIQNLKNSNPNYHFQIYYTGIDWTEAVTMEYQGHGNSPKNLVSYKGEGSYQRHGQWFCPICGQSTYDSGLYCASREAIEYMLDPRNSLSGSSVFQFKNLEYADVSAADIQNVISNKYSSYSYINNPTAINAMQNASTRLNLNGFSILAKIVNEQGKGTSALISGNGYNGNYVGYYNFFNVGAYGNGSSAIITNGLKYAYNHGWNSVENSIIGGSEFYKNSYIGKGQNTLYYQRFNVAYDQALFSHQYQQDIMGAETSATLMKDYYSIAGKLGIDQYFIVPVFENMPSSSCPRPSTAGNNALQYENAEVKVNGLAVCAAPCSNRIISYLNAGEKVKILKKATQTSGDGNYWDIIVSEIDGTYGYVVRSGIGNSLPNYIFDAKYYADKYLDLKVAFGYDEEKLLNHFLCDGIKEGRSASPTFDVRYYLENNVDLLNAYGKNNFVAAYNHFVQWGRYEWRKNSEEYDGVAYKEKMTELNGYTPIQLMVYYLDSKNKPEEKPAEEEQEESSQEKMVKEKYEIFSTKEFPLPKYIFDANYYYYRYCDLRVAFGKDDQKLYNHFINDGIKEGRSASPTFDVRYYLENNVDLYNVYGKGNFEDAYQHFIQWGCRELRISSEEYNGEYYKKTKKEFTNYTPIQMMEYYMNSGRNNGDIAIENGMSVNENVKPEKQEEIKPPKEEPEVVKPKQEENKVEKLEYEIFSTKDFPLPKYVFDANYYYYKYCDLRVAFGKDDQKLYNHFINDGIKEGRSGSPEFEVEYYIENNADLKAVYGKDYVSAFNHFLSFGIHEGRKTSSLFDVRYYLENHQDLLEVYGKTNYEEAYQHYAQWGRIEGRKCIAD